MVARNVSQMVSDCSHSVLKRVFLCAAVSECSQQLEECRACCKEPMFLPDSISGSSHSARLILPIGRNYRRSSRKLLEAAGI